MFASCTRMSYYVTGMSFKVFREGGVSITLYCLNCKYFVEKILFIEFIMTIKQFKRVMNEFKCYITKANMYLYTYNTE